MSHSEVRVAWNGSNKNYIQRNKIKTTLKKDCICTRMMSIQKMTKTFPKPMIDFEKDGAKQTTQIHVKNANIILHTFWLVAVDCRVKGDLCRILRTFSHRDGIYIFILARLSYRIKWAFLITFCPVSVRPSVDFFFFFTFLTFSPGTRPILAKLGTKHYWWRRSSSS